MPHRRHAGARPRATARRSAGRRAPGPLRCERRTRRSRARRRGSGRCRSRAAPGRGCAAGDLARAGANVRKRPREASQRARIGGRGRAHRDEPFPDPSPDPAELGDAHRIAAERRAGGGGDEQRHRERGVGEGAGPEGERLRSACPRSRPAHWRGASPPTAAAFLRPARGGSPFAGSAPARRSDARA